MKWELVFPTALVTLDRRMKEYAEGDWHMYK